MASFLSADELHLSFFGELLGWRWMMRTNWPGGGKPLLKSLDALPSQHRRCKIQPLEAALVMDTCVDRQMSRRPALDVALAQHLAAARCDRLVLTDELHCR
jgi:hypothetical protein